MQGTYRNREWHNKAFAADAKSRDAKKQYSLHYCDSGVTSTAIQVTGWDIDDVTETGMLINEHKVDLPSEIVADVAPKTVTIELENGYLAGRGKFHHLCLR